MGMKTTTGSESDLAVCNYALGYADGLIVACRRRNEPTEERFAEHFRRGLSDASARCTFDPPNADIPPGALGGAVPHATRAATSNANRCGG